jgi:hypothetical protein
MSSIRGTWKCSAKDGSDSMCTGQEPALGILLSYVQLRVLWPYEWPQQCKKVFAYANFVIISHVAMGEYLRLFLGTFAKLREATNSFVMSVRPSICSSAYNNSAPTGRILMKIYIWTFSKICQKCDKKSFSHLWQYLTKFFLEWEIFYTKM